MKTSRPPARKTQRQATARTTTSRKGPSTDGQWQTTRDDEVRSADSPLFLEDVQHVALVCIKGGVTRNMGEFEFIRVDAEVTMPCLPIEEGEGGINWAKEFCSRKVTEFINDEVALATGSAG